MRHLTTTLDHVRDAVARIDADDQGIARGVSLTGIIIIALAVIGLMAIL